MKTFDIVDSLDREQWERFVCDHPKGTIFHTPEMLEVFQTTRHYDPMLLAAVDRQGDILALLLAVRIQTLPNPFGRITSRSVHFAEPLCRETPEGSDALAAILREHDARAKQSAIFAEVRPLFDAGVERPLMERSGYEYQEYLNYVVRLQRDKQALWNAMTSDCRRRIKSNAKKGLDVREMTTEEGIDPLYRFLRLAYQRARVPLPDKSLFDQALRVLGPRDMLRISVAYQGDNPVGASVALAYRDRIIAWHGGADRLPNLYPMEALDWQEIEWGHERNFSLYDFGGAGWAHKPYGVRKFKAKFGGDLVEYGRYRKVYSGWRFAIAETGYGLLRRVTDPTQWTRAGAITEG